MGAAVERFVDGIRDWEVQSLVCMHSCKNTTAALTYALEAEIARRTSRRPVMILQLRKETLKEPKLSSSTGEKTKIPTYNVTRRQVTSKKKHAQEGRISLLGCDMTVLTFTSQYGVTS